MLDSFGREINYIRMSLTGRCQQRCTYCARENGAVCVKENELSADDFVFVAGVFSSVGFKKIRLTGGEPLLRRDIVEIISGIRALNKFDDISMTTNGLFLSDCCEKLKSAGLQRINISLDSTDSDIYKKITGADIKPVLDGIKKAVDTFDSVKINSVLIKGINDNFNGLISLAKEYPITLRFIELMPMGGKGEGIKGENILEKYSELIPTQKADIHSPEQLYHASGYKGKIGLINPVSNSFCNNCNRMRLTWDGKLRPCLGVDSELDAREAIVSRDENALKELIIRAVKEKPAQNNFESDFNSQRSMTQIGG